MEIIAEAGINHNGDINTAVEMVWTAKECGADTIKFQYYLPEILCCNRNSYDAYDVLTKNKMHYHWLSILKNECDNAGIEFLCTPFCRLTAEDVEPYVKRFKVASPEVKYDFVKEVSRYGKPLILPTGKVTQDELDRIMEINADITLLYCISLYPALPGDYNLKELERLRRRYGVPIGISDHTQGLKVSIEASEKGASIIERHFCLNKNCPDSAVSLLPQEIKKLINIIRRKS